MKKSNSRGFLSGVSVLLLVSCIVLGVFLFREHSRYNALSEAFGTQNNDIKTMRSKIADTEATVSDLTRQITNITSQLTAAGDENNSLQSRLSFWDTSAVIVTTTGSSYHKYGCSHISGSPIYIFNLENAKAKRYIPCLDCKPPLESGQVQIKLRFSDDSSPKSKYAPNDESPIKSRFSSSDESSITSSRNGLVPPEEAVKALGIDPAPAPTQWRSMADSFFKK